MPKKLVGCWELLYNNKKVAEFLIKNIMLKLADIFPMPDYLRMPAVGLDISDQSLKYLSLGRTRKKIFIESFGNKPINPGIIESGQIKQTEEFVKLLKNCRKEFKSKFLLVSIPEEKTFIGDIQLPFMDEKNIRGSLEMQLEEYIPLPVKEAIFDYEILETVSDQKGEKKYFNISFAAAPSKIIISYRDALKEAGFIPLIFETEPHALIRALIRPEEKNTQMLIDFGRTRATFIISYGRKICLTSTIKVSGETLDTAVSRALSVSLEEGERIKKEQGLLESDKNGKVFTALLSVASVIKSEAKKNIDYWQSHADGSGPENREIEKIILAGGDANLKGLAEYLSQELGVPAELGNPWVNIFSFEEHIPEIERKESLRYAIAIGLALRSV